MRHHNRGAFVRATWRRTSFLIASCGTDLFPEALEAQNLMPFEAITDEVLQSLKQALPACR
jgi:hypothetical protein